MAINFGILGQGQQQPKGGVIATLPASGSSGGGDDIGSLFGALQGLLGKSMGETHGQPSNPPVGAQTAPNPMAGSINSGIGNPQARYAGVASIGGQQNTDSRLSQLAESNLNDLYNRPAFQTALQAQKVAQQNGITKSPILTVVDYSLPATEKRLWTIDTQSNKVLMNTWVAQGKTPGFSNTPGSHQSSTGLFLATNPYRSQSLGRDALKLQGLDKGINDNAFARGIVIHGGNYVGPDKQGTSWGCFTVPNEVAPKLIGLTQNGTLVHAYAPGQKALSNFSNNLTPQGKRALQTQLNSQPKPQSQNMGISNNPSGVNPTPIDRESLLKGSNMTTQSAAIPLLKEFEGLENFKNGHSHARWDVNAFRLGYGSDTITRPDGTIVKVKEGMSVTPEDAERDLARRTLEFENRAIEQVGPDNWNRLPEPARAALTSVTYNYGSLPKGVVESIKRGDGLSSIAGSVRALGSHNKGINRNRRNKEADIIANSMHSVQASNNNTSPLASPELQAILHQNSLLNHPYQQQRELQDQMALTPGMPIAQVGNEQQEVGNIGVNIPTNILKSNYKA